MDVVVLSVETVNRPALTVELLFSDIVDNPEHSLLCLWPFSPKQNAVKLTLAFS